MATPIHTAEQGDYRMAQQCGADGITAEDVAANYRLSGGARPIERIGGGWAEFGIEAGSVLESGEDVEQMRRLLAGRAPDDRTQLVKPKVAVAPEALLDAAPFVAALEAAAAERGQGLAELVATDPWSVKRPGRLSAASNATGNTTAPRSWIWPEWPPPPGSTRATSTTLPSGTPPGSTATTARPSVCAATTSPSTAPKGSASSRAWPRRRWPSGWNRFTWRRCASPWPPWSPGWDTRWPATTATANAPNGSTPPAWSAP